MSNVKKPRLVSDARAILTEEYMRSLDGVKTYREVMQETGLKKSTIYKYARKYGVKLRTEPPVSGDQHYNWKGGRIRKGHGYYVLVDGYEDRNKRYVAEHRFVVEQNIGRELREDEVVHHLDGNPFNNDFSNLLHMTKQDHDRFHLIMGCLDIDHKNLTKEQVMTVINSKDKIADFVKGLLVGNVC